MNHGADENEDEVYIALETMAGKGSEIGRTFEELAKIYDGVHKKDRLRVCFDTCHVNDAGYDLVHVTRAFSGNLMRSSVLIRSLFST